MHTVRGWGLRHTSVKPALPQCLGKPLQGHTNFLQGMPVEPWRPPPRTAVAKRSEAPAARERKRGGERRRDTAGEGRKTRRDVTPSETAGNGVESGSENLPNSTHAHRVISPGILGDFLVPALNLEDGVRTRQTPHEQMNIVKTMSG